VSVGEDGSEAVELVLQPDTLPSPSERLQKAAFVRAAGANYDGLVVDKQRPGPVVSTYFLDTFLGMEEVSDAATRTRTLYRAVSHVLDEVRPELAPEEQRQLDSYLRGAMMSQTIDADDLVTRAPGPDIVRVRLAARLDSELPDRIFDTDRDVAVQLTRRRIGLAANGLRVSASSTAWTDMVRIEPPDIEGGDYVVTIRTAEWRES
jgi:nucleoid-associated protein YejK